MFDVFAKAVKTAPNGTAIILTNKEKINYQQVNELVGLWSKYFIANGVGQGDRVAVLTEYEDRHPFIHLALDQINATVVPLDMEIPTAQLEVDLKNLNLKKILIDKTLAQRYTIPDSLKLYAPEIGITPDTFNVELVSIKRDPNIPNYIVASSGVTQNKKWIPICSAGISDWAEIQRKELQFTPQDKILCTRSPAYDARIWEYILGFAGGSTLVLLSHTQRRDLNAILEQCEQEEITSIILIASQLAIPNLDAMMKRLAKAGLKHLMVTGDACTDRLKQLCEQNDISLWNCYGPTEATFGSSILRVNHMKLIDENQHPVVPIGFPNSSEVKFHLVDGCGYIESPFLSDGYLNNPEQTEKNFPILSIEGRQVRVFNTQNRFTIKDGMLLFQGRIANDAHCKVSGVKVEPYTIQHCIEQYNSVLGEDVLHAYVVVKPWLNNYKPFAYVVVQKEFSKQQFMNYLKDWLRKEEIPIIIELDKFPRLIPSEKIDQRVLLERVDNPEEFFFNEGKRNKQKFSNAGRGLVIEDELEINRRLKDQTLPRMSDDELFNTIDRLVLAANHLDQELNTKESNQDAVLNLLTTAYELFQNQQPHFPDTAFEDIPIPSLASVAQLMFYYGKALRYRTIADSERELFLRKAVSIGDYLENKSSTEDTHAFRGRLLTYNLGLMLCLRDQEKLSSALELAKQQSAIAVEKQELFMIIQFGSYIADILLAMQQMELAYEQAQQNFLLAKQFYSGKHTIYFNALVSYIKSCVQNKKESTASELSLEILNAYKDDPLCGVKPWHLTQAKKTLLAIDPLTKVWCSTLGVEQSDSDQEFMFLGGDSFQLNILLAGIQKDIDPSYTHQELISLPLINLEQIRSSLQNKKLLLNDRALVRALFPINPDLQNYFFLPPLLGEGYFTYKELAKLFYSRHQFNVYGLSDPSLFDKQLLPKSLEEAAARYTKKIREIQPKGPYYLFGFSFGSTLAYAVAKQLHEQNQRIERLHLVDGFPPALYQRLPADAHSKLLEELINFVIQTLNNRFYDEELKSIRLVNFDRLSAKRQIDKAFNQLLSKVKKEPSRLLLALARQHLSFMLEAKDPVRLPLWAQLYLSTPNQTYLDVIYQIPNIVHKSPECQSYYWNHYFEEVNLVGKRVDVPHLDLLSPQKHDPEKSADIFWRKAHDPLYNFQLDYLALKPFYFLEQLNKEKSSCKLYSLHWSELAYYKRALAQWPQLVSFYAYPIYERISEKDKHKDRLFTTKYALSFIIDNAQLRPLHEFLEKRKVQQYLPNQSSEARGRKHMAQLIAEVSKEPPKNILINLDVYWNGSYLMSLYFNCHADYKALLRTIYVELKMEFDDDKTQLDVNLFNFSHIAFNIYKPSIFEAVKELSHGLNHFISLLMPHVQTHCIKENRL